MRNAGYKVLSPTAILGYGFPEKSFKAGVESRPDCIAVDAGSTDPGPYYLGAGKSFTSRAAVKRDLEFMLAAAMELSVPCIIGTAGGCGAREHVEWNRSIIWEIARSKGYSFRMAVIHADVSGEDAARALRLGKLHPLHPAPEIDEEEIAKSIRIVAQMGAGAEGYKGPGNGLQCHPLRPLLRSYSLCRAGPEERLRSRPCGAYGQNPRMRLDCGNSRQRL